MYKTRHYKNPTQPKLHQPFLATQQGPLGDWRINVSAIRNKQSGTMMCIELETGPIYITKKQAMDFFGLEDAS